MDRHAQMEQERTGKPTILFEDLLEEIQATRAAYGMPPLFGVSPSPSRKKKSVGGVGASLQGIRTDHY